MTFSSLTTILHQLQQHLYSDIQSSWTHYLKVHAAQTGKKLQYPWISLISCVWQVAAAPGQPQSRHNTEFSKASFERKRLETRKSSLEFKIIFDRLCVVRCCTWSTSIQNVQLLYSILKEMTCRSRSTVEINHQKNFKNLGKSSLKFKVSLIICWSTSIYNFQLHRDLKEKTC